METYTMADDRLLPIWDLCGAYERFMGKWSRASGRKFIKWLAPENGLHWLDVGCGTGALTQVIFDYAAPRQVSAIDTADIFITFAREQFKSDRISFEVGNALELPYDDDAYDVAVSGLVLNFVPDQIRMLCEMRRVVRPSGKVALYVWDFAGGLALAQHINFAIAARNPAAAEKVSDGQQASTTSPEALEKIYGEAGLTGIVRTSIDVDVTFVDFNDYWVSNTGFKSPVAHYIAGLTNADQARFMHEVKNRLPEASDGSIKYVARVQAIFGTVRE